MSKEVEGKKEEKKGEKGEEWQMIANVCRGIT